MRVKGASDMVNTCWSTPTASSPSYIMSTQPSLEARTKRDMRAWGRQKMIKKVKRNLWLRWLHLTLLKMGWDHNGFFSNWKWHFQSLVGAPKRASWERATVCATVARLTAYLPKVIKVVLVSDPFVVSVDAIWLVGDIPCILPLTHKELSFEELWKKAILSAHNQPSFSLQIIFLE